MYIKDRGNIKWDSLLLVEHKKRLRKLKETEQDLDRPDLSGQELARMDYVLGKALNCNSLLKVGYYQHKRLHRIRGRVVEYHPAPAGPKIILNEPVSDTEHKIELSDIIELEIIKD